MKKERIHLTVKPVCEYCGAQLMLNQYDMYFKEEALVIETECIMCGELQFVILDITEYIDLEAEFWMAYFKKKPKGGDDEKAS